MALSILDIIIILFIIVFMVKGYRRGLIRQVTAIIAIIISIYVANEQYFALSKSLINRFDLSRDLGDIIAFILIILIVAIVINYLGYLLSQMANFMFLSSVDSFGGFLFGFMKGVLIVYLILLILYKLPFDFIDEAIEGSYLASKFLILNPFLEDKISELSRW